VNEPNATRADDARPKAHDGPEARIDRIVERRARRKLIAQHDRKPSVWIGLGTFGLVGWAVSIPTIAGLALGLWLDHRVEASSDRSWTLTFLVAGVCIGCVHAWYWIQREMHPR
jgi:ATP synthase protein I